ncbi:MAG: ribonuclease HI [Buchnera aphidicola (Periphyllus lyropictus)]|uniref:ribonuclease HI n=1 Tax=Buchnera aphidicola TaxID=9 RepID=UPI001EC10058|nr:ribonuclease HI [Buchnera aphidicola]NIH16627.1 ribonuclease HI [Buchnera aphidicola (Periphyllus lyropictus)]USS94539.1 ribonuclease HI [Buchnera aphidicola (Periphyllus lyropictus)]
MKKIINIFSDGSCLGNPGPGGYCTIIKYKKKKKIFSSGFFFTTNNRMELMSVIIGIKKIKIASKIIINTDSKYVNYGVTKWMKIWIKNNWLKKNNKKVKNIDLWKKLNKLIKKHIKINWNWVKSHSGQLENELCDLRAKKEAKNPKKIDKGYILKKFKNK